MEPTPRYLSYMGRGPKRIPHWEHWSDPDAATYIAGIDYHERPRSCMMRINEMYPFVGLGVPATDEVVVRPMMYVALTYDHRMIDGREGVGFLSKIKQLVEEPTELLLGI